MVVKSDDKGRKLTFLRQTTQVVKEKLMPTMNTIKKTYRSYLHFLLSSFDFLLSTFDFLLLLVVPMLDAILQLGILNELDLHAGDSATIFLRSAEYVVELLRLIHLAV